MLGGILRISRFNSGRQTKKASSLHLRTYAYQIMSNKAFFRSERTPNRHQLWEGKLYCSIRFSFDIQMGQRERQS